MGRTEGIGGQFLRVPNDRDGMAKVVQRLHGVDVDADTFFTQKLNQLRVAAAAFVARHIKRHDALPPETFQRRIDGRLFLTLFIHSHSSRTVPVPNL